jgi:hypothetical protein
MNRAERYEASMRNHVRFGRLHAVRVLFYHLHDEEISPFISALTAFAYGVSLLG